mgnify:CR=1 FL=1
MTSFAVRITLRMRCTPEEARIITDAAINAAFTRCHEMHGEIGASSYIAEQPAKPFDPYEGMSECDKARARRAQHEQMRRDGV